MSGSSRHGSVRPPAAAGSRQGGNRPGTGRQGGSGQGGGRQASGRSGAGGAHQGAANGGAASRSGNVVDADRVAGLLEPVIAAVGMDLEAVRITAAGRRRLLRLVVDADGGVGLDDIAVVSREVSAALDDSPVMGEQPYTLEVSSPGVDRPLTERRHWRRAIGRLVVAPLTVVPEGSDPAGATVEGRISGASAGGITLEIEGESRQFGYGDLGPGKIKIEFARIDAAADDEDLVDEHSGDEAPGDEDIDNADSDDEGADEEGSDGY
jgi:ribosome maturation factor RimP